MIDSHRQEAVMTKNFVIDQVSWHTLTPGNTESREHIFLRFHSLHKSTSSYSKMKNTGVAQRRGANDDAI